MALRRGTIFTDRDEGEGSLVQGVLFTSLGDAVVEMNGKEALEAFLDDINPDRLSDLNFTAFIASEYYPLTSLEKLLSLMEERSDGAWAGDGFMRTWGREAARAAGARSASSAGAVQGALLSLDTLLKRMFVKGRFATEMLDEAKGMLSIKDMADFKGRCAFIEGVLEHAAGESVFVDMAHTRCVSQGSDECRWEMEWREK